jgi:hypothetical protein
MNVQHQHNVSAERQSARRNNNNNNTNANLFETHPRRDATPGLMNIGRSQGGTFYRTNSGNFTDDPSPRNNVSGIDLLLRALNMPTDFENVVVSPSTEQIDDATEIIAYASDMSANYSSRCPITLEDFQEGQMVRRIHHCNHIFNSTAFNNWFERNVRCPVCRFDIRDHSERENSIDSEDFTDDNNSTHINNRDSGEEEVTTSRIDLSGNRLRYIVEYEMPNSEYILYVPDASSNRVLDSQDEPTT